MTKSAEERILASVPERRGKEEEHLRLCVRENGISSAGSFVNYFERAIATYVGAAHDVATINGTCALEMALRIAGVGPVEVVPVPDWTFVATANDVCHIGAQPHFVDIDPDCWCLDPALINQAIEEANVRVAAIVSFHALGHPADLDALIEKGITYGIPVVEEAAGALGTSY